jgi:4-amino-4-deoxy-L-arabinose transferase-like glycosyltransferase
LARSGFLQLPSKKLLHSFSLALPQIDLLFTNEEIKKRTWWLFAALAIILFVKLGATPIYILDEAKNAQCAREMLQRNDWVVPTFNGELRTDKPALHYFFMMASYKIFGVNEFAARFFSAIMGLLTVLITFIYTRKHTNALTAFATAVVLTCSSHFLFEFRLSVPDPYLIFFITLGLFSGFTWLQQNNKAQLYIAAASFALATLAKGPIALALPGLCLLIWIVWKRKWKTVFTWHLIPALLLLCLITLPWYIAVDKATNGAWTRGFFIDHNLNRFSDPQEGHGGLFIITILFVTLGLLPFMAYIGEVIRKRKAVFNEELIQFAAIVFIAFVVFFSISSTKLPNYPMPCYPFAAIFLGKFIASVLNGNITTKKYPYYILIAITILIPVAGYFAIQQEEAAASTNWVSLLLLITPLLLLFYSFQHKKNVASWFVSAIVISYTVFNIIALQWAYPMLYNTNPVTATKEIVQKATAVYGYQLYNPSYNFYLDQHVKKISDPAELNTIAATNKNAVLITREEYLPDLKNINWKVIAKHHDLFELPTTVILAPNVP